MERRNIIIILIVAIVIAAAAIGFSMFKPAEAKQPCTINVTSAGEQYGGGQLSFRLTDFNGTPISKQPVNVTVTAKDGKEVVGDVIETDSQGNGRLELNLESGEYSVNVTYSGNENFTANSTAQKLTILEEVAEEPEIESEPAASSDSSSSSDKPDAVYYDKKYNIFYNDEGVIVDPDGHHSQGVGDNYYEVKEFFDSGKEFD